MHFISVLTLVTALSLDGRVVKAATRALDILLGISALSLVALAYKLLLQGVVWLIRLSFKARVNLSLGETTSPKPETDRLVGLQDKAHPLHALQRLQVRGMGLVGHLHLELPRSRKRLRGPTPSHERESNTIQIHTTGPAASK